MLDKICRQNHYQMTEAQLAGELVNRLPADDEGALFWT